MAALRKLCIWQLLLGLGVVLCLVTSTSAAEGDIQLLGSVRAFEGRLMIEHNGVLRSVCFADWTFQDASTACRQLGYSKGAMITRANDGEFASPAASPTIQAPGCTTAITNRLSDCPNFEYREDLTCSSSEVDISCYVNDFEGCYLTPPGSWTINQLLPHPTDASTIERCIQFCRQANARFAALAELRCLCGADVGSLGTAQPTQECATPCTDDPTAACGEDINGVRGYFAVWPVTVGESSTDVTSADRCLYSPNFPGHYPTTGSATVHEYGVTLPFTAYVSFTVKMLDLNALDSVHVQDRTAGLGMRMVDVATFAVGTSVVPFSFRLSRFALIFSIDEQSPNERDYGFDVCYRSLATLPPDPTTLPPTAPPTAPPTNPPTNPPTAPQTAAPTASAPNPTTMSTALLTSPQPSTKPIPSPSTTARPRTTVATSLTSTLVTSTETTVRTTTIDTIASTDRPQEGDMCPAYHGAPLYNRSGRGEDEVLFLNTGDPFNCTGYITHVRYYSASNEKLKVSVWHPEHIQGENFYRYIWAAEVEIGGVAPGAVVAVPLVRDWLPFRSGDVLGIRVQNSPLVYSNVPVADVAGIPWRQWTLEGAGQYGPDNVELRNSSNAAELNRTYSISATLQAKRRCYVPTVRNSAFTDAIVPYVYEGETYTLECARDYNPEGGNAFFCHANGTFNRELRCEGGSSVPGVNFTVLIMCLVILVLLCLTIFVVVCALVCCRKKSDKAGKPPSKKPAAKKSSRKPAPKLPPVVVPATAIPITDDAAISSQNGDQAPILSDMDDDFTDDDSQLNTGADDADGLESNRPTVPPPAPPKTEPQAVDSPDAADEGAPVINNPIHIVSPFARSIYSTPASSGFAAYPQFSAPPVAPPPPNVAPPPPPVAPPPPPLVNPSEPPEYPQASQPGEIDQTHESPPDTPSVGSGNPLIPDDNHSDNQSESIPRGRPSRIIGQGISSRLGVFED